MQSQRVCIQAFHRDLAASVHSHNECAYPGASQCAQTVQHKQYTNLKGIPYMHDYEALVNKHAVCQHAGCGFAVVSFRLSLNILLSWLQVWTMSQPTPNFTLDGHDKGVNSVDYFSGGTALLCLAALPTAATFRAYMVLTFACQLTNCKLHADMQHSSW